MWPDDAFPARRCGTHDLPLDDVLALGVQLSCCPPRVTIWTISGKDFRPGGDSSTAVQAAAIALADVLWEDFARA
jgi:hypothetical protein